MPSSACRFFDPRLASSIILRGHAIMQQTRELIEAQGFDVIYDADSTFVWLNTLTAGGSSLQQTYGLDSALELEYETHLAVS